MYWAKHDPKTIESYEDYQTRSRRNVLLHRARVREQGGIQQGVPSIREGLHSDEAEAKNLNSTTRTTTV